jgi:GTP cyclohydrolase I
MKVKELSWKEVFDRISSYNFAKGLKVYGVPKGGMILAGFLKNVELVTDPDYAELIVDDIRDSGKTEQYYKNLFPTTPVISFFHKSDFPGQWVIFPWEANHPAGVETVDQNIVRILEYIGEDVHRDGLRDTPRRVIKSYGEIFSGYHRNPKDLFTVFEEPNCDTMVVLKDIEFYSTCEHHMLPFYGKAHVAYIPNNRKIVGISKLARLVDLFARRLQVQERIGNQVTDALMEHLQPLGAACVIEAAHMCMKCRGVGKQNSVMTTSSLTGVFKTDMSVRTEFMNFI